MYETRVTVVGNVLTAPEWRRTSNTQALVTTFRVASTSRRYDRATGAWVDGDSLRVRVSCWRALASNVASSVTTGDPVIVTGRLFTRDWTDEEGGRRTSYELEATTVGHDLSRGRGKFARVRPTTSTTVTDEARSEGPLGGEHTEPVPAAEAPVRFDDTPYDDGDEPVETPVEPPTVDDAPDVGDDRERER